MPDTRPHIFRKGRVPISVGLLALFGASLVWYIVSGLSSLPGMIAFGSLLLLLVLYVNWRERDHADGGAKG